MDFFRKKESRIELRKEFAYAVRPIFLKYLPIVDEKTVKALFSEDNIATLKRGFVPQDWSVHHQKPLAWGGRSFNREILSEIEKMPLTEEQEKDCQNNIYAHFIKLKYQMDNFLKKAHHNGSLERVFIRLFKNHLILLPHKLHSHLEKNYLMPQISYISDLKSKEENIEKKEVLAPLSYILWDQFIYQGKHFTLAQENRIIKVKEDCHPKKIFKRLAAYIKYQKQRSA